MRRELQASHNELWQQLEPGDVDDLIAIARLYGPNEVSYPRARELAELSALVRDSAKSMTLAELNERIAAAEHLEADDAERLRGAWAEYARPPLTIPTT